MRNTLGVARLALLAVLALGLSATGARAQAPGPEEERLKILTDPEEVKKKFEKDKTRPPLEMFRSQVAPFDILPYVKANHWSTLSLDLRANYEDYAGSLLSSPVPLVGLPQEIIYTRDARLQKSQRGRLGMQVMMPRVPKEIGLELTRPESIRADEVWSANLRVLEPHQMLILFLTGGPNDSYALWNRFQALYPNNADRTDLQAVEKQRYYRLVLPLDTDKPPVSPHPLTWTTLSHVVWDGMPADDLNPSQQQAMVDWLHWGGQLVFNGGAGAPYNVLKDSFIGEHLPAEPGGENAQLTAEDLRPLSEAYRPLNLPRPDDADDAGGLYVVGPPGQRGLTYYAPAPIAVPGNRPLFVNGLVPKTGAAAIPMGESGGRSVGVEWRVGRGRVLMLSFDLNDPSIATWPGLDTFVRRVVLRRPEEGRAGRGYASRPGPLPGPDLSWVRYVSRDLNSPEVSPPKRAARDAEGPTMTPGRRLGPGMFSEPEFPMPTAAVGEWQDGSSVPRYCVAQLESASGIKIPGSGFVLKVILAYIVLLVPLNWLICRYVFKRGELAWVVVPLLSLGFAVGVERAAAFDMGYNSASDEIDLLEIQGGYPRAHLSRFLSLYTTGRTRFNLTYPNDPTALALPLDNNRSLRGEDVSTTTWRSYPVPGLENYLVQPRSLAFVRAEQMLPLDGAISVETEGGVRRVVNRGNLTIRDAVLVEPGGDGERTETYLGTVGPGATVEVRETTAREAAPADLSRDFDPEKLLGILRRDYEARPENAGELRLVGWAPGTVAGQAIEPAVDRQRGFTAVVVHLTMGAPPPPVGPIYDALARAADPPPSVSENQASTENAAAPGRGARAAPGLRSLMGFPDPIQNIPRAARRSADAPAPPLERPNDATATADEEGLER